MTKGLFVTATGTDVGKTYVSGLLLGALLEKEARASYYKAAMSGNVRDGAGQLLAGDALEVKRLSGSAQSVESMCPYVLEEALSPHLAARNEGREIKLDVVKTGYHALEGTSDFILMEGSGGILCPLAEGEDLLMLEDVVRALALPSVIVADAGLGSINGTVLTVHYMRAQNLAVRGIILNRYEAQNPMHRDNAHMIERLAEVPILATVAEGAQELDFVQGDVFDLYKGGAL